MNIKELSTKVDTASRIFGSITDINYPASNLARRIKESGPNHIDYTVVGAEYLFRFAWSATEVSVKVVYLDSTPSELIMTIYHINAGKVMELLLNKYQLAA